MLLITNNPKVRETAEIKIPIEFIDGSYLDVLNRVRQHLVDDRYHLVTHPLSGSIKPNETIYKSIILLDEYHGAISMENLDMIDHAIEVYHRFQAMRATPNWTDRVLQDFALIDYDLVTSALNRINVPPSFL
ncbi:MAG: GrdX family protein [Aerococcus sp.]|nr:GrdX family protein [Aerococcus sp.]